ncbi:MAG: hypothetical protein ACXAEU_16650 [Candidatus Hodarchaeales archaeon]|jgi:hypothetical protein
MTEIFTTWLNTLLYPIVDIYGQVLAGFPFNFLSYILSAVFLALFIQAVFFIFPPIKTIVDTIMFPFRIIHVWLHVQEARKIIENRQSDGNSLKFLSYFSTGFSVKAEKSGIALSGICTARDASRIANAPLKGVSLILLVLIFLTPILRVSFVGKLIHMYIFIGITTSSFPSSSDYKFAYNMLLLNTSIPSSRTLLPLVGFSCGFIIAMIWTTNIVFAIIWGVAMVTLSTWVILMEEARKDTGGRNDNNEKKYYHEETEKQEDYYHNGMLDILESTILINQLDYNN